MQIEVAYGSVGRTRRQRRGHDIARVCTKGACPNELDHLLFEIRA